MESEILSKLQEQEKKIEAIYKSVEKTRRYFLLTVIVSVVVVVFPLIGILFMLPNFIKIISGNSLGL